MANQRLLDKLLKRQEEEMKVEVELFGLADTPFFVKLSKEQYKEIEKEAKTDGKREFTGDAYDDRLDALCISRSLHDHNEEPVFSGELYDALGTWDPVEAMGKVITLAEERVIRAAVFECLGYVDQKKVKEENDELKN